MNLTWTCHYCVCCHSHDPSLHIQGLFVGETSETEVPGAWAQGRSGPRAAWLVVEKM